MAVNGSPPSGRDAHGRFAAGNAGRPFGTRNRASARVARALLSDFEENQLELLVRMRRWFLPQYLQMISRLLPRDVEDDQANALDAGVTLADLRGMIDRVEADGGSLADLETMMEASSRGRNGAETDIIGR